MGTVPAAVDAAADASRDVRSSSNMMADSCVSVAVPAPAMGRTGSAASASLGQRASAAEGAGRAQAAHRTLAAREARPIERAGRCGAEQGDASRAVAARSTAATRPSAIARR